jgi:hypothetical protein
VDPAQHPDLIQLGRTLRRQLEDTLEAELEAARAAALRRRSVRDLLLEIEDNRGRICVTTTDGVARVGDVVSVGIDHVQLESHGQRLIVALDHIVGFEVIG